MKNEIMKNLEGKKSGGLILLGGILLVSATALAIRGTIKSCKQQNEEDLVNENVKEYVKKHWKKYIPTVVCTIGGMSCLTAGVVSYEKRIGIITASVIAGDRIYSKYKNEIDAMINDEEKIELESINKNLVKEVQTNDCSKFETEQWFKDIYSGQYFKSNRSKIDRAIFSANQHLRNFDGSIYLETVYGDMGVPINEISETHAWNNEQSVGVHYVGCLMPDGITSCVGIEFDEHPREL